MTPRHSPSLASYFYRGAAIVLVAGAAGGCNTAIEPSKPTACVADAYEDNDTEETAVELPEMTDHPDSAQDLSLTAHMTRDEDWFRVHIRDDGLGGNPVISVAVSTTDFDVSTWFVCDDKHGSQTQCDYGSVEYTTVNGLDAVRGCAGAALDSMVEADGSVRLDTGNLVESVSECTGTSSDGGTLFIRVRQRSTYESPSSLSCSYNLAIDVR